MEMPALIAVAKVMISVSFCTLSLSRGIPGPERVSSNMSRISPTHMAESLVVRGRMADHITAGNNLSRNWHVNQHFP